MSGVQAYNTHSTKGLNQTVKATLISPSKPMQWGVILMKNHVCILFYNNGVTANKMFINNS